MGRRVLVTRPQPGAGATARRLEKLGFEPVMLPLTEIRAMPAGPLPSAAAIDAVAVTSANALRHAPPALIAAFARKPCFAVGDESAAAARKAGFADLFAGPGDAAGLARAILGKIAPGAHILYLCGRVRLSGFEDFLRDRGVNVVALETYDAPEVRYPVENVRSVLGPAPVDAALLHSAKAAALLAELAMLPTLRHLFAGTEFFCLSPRIGAALAGLADGRVFNAGTPDEAALLALLRQQALSWPLFSRG